MFISFFFNLRKAGLPVSITELLSLLSALDKRLASFNIQAFYYLSRTALVKDERYYDRFDQVFAETFDGLEYDHALEGVFNQIPEEWLRKQAEKLLSEEEKQKIQSLGGWEELMETLKKRLEEQKEEHHGGNKWIGTGGTSPFGAYGYNPEGVRIGQDESRHRRASKVWDKREFKNLDDSVELNTRNLKVALRKLRKFARQGSAEELDLDDTIRSTASNAGYLDIKMVPERHNAIKVLLLLDIGGSMDDHIRICEELFSASKAEFKHLEYYYFHNFTYEYLWKDNTRRFDEATPTAEVINRYPSDYKLIFVGDASMSPYEITYPGGSVEHWNEEAGAVWFQRLLSAFPSNAWLNPDAEQNWDRRQSNRLIRQLNADKMFPLTIGGLDSAIKSLL
ncbi:MULTISPECIES: VWA domain-containing protein [Cycloclasticus]|uniref:von Willebrand factor type A domain-containing protein n=1 Tax=Cycloclasticus pugetii TaxID=34068 RepID=A0AB33Z1R7_9GAMM|nr:MULTISPECIES: VWA domain-containing protein [Cycloclasticus]ATI03112.1 VWA domain-containing protein [Cycloclasticus sp. PY97N]EPD13386.1 von Willebrand factor type A domain-containing protein [Cycloclasticus pugetii]